MSAKIYLQAPGEQKPKWSALKMKATEDNKPSFRKHWRDLLGFSVRLDGNDATGQPSILNNEEFILIRSYPERLNTSVQSGRISGDLNGRRANAHWTTDTLCVSECFLRESREPGTCQRWNLIDGLQESCDVVKISVSSSWHMSVIPALGRLVQEDYEFQVSLGLHSETLSWKAKWKKFVWLFGDRVSSVPTYSKFVWTLSRARMVLRAVHDGNRWGTNGQWGTEDLDVLAPPNNLSLTYE